MEGGIEHSHSELLRLCSRRRLFNCEALNLACGSLDKLHPDQPPQIGNIKDCAAAAVLVASTGALIAFILFI